MSELEQLAKEPRDTCAFCNHPTVQSSLTVAVVSGDKELVGKNKKKEPLYVCHPATAHMAPVCPGCEAERLKKIRGMRPLNAAMGIIMIVPALGGLCGGGYLFSMLGLIPCFIGSLLVMVGLFSVALVYRGFKRGFGKPEKTLADDAGLSLQAIVQAELDAERAGNMLSPPAFVHTEEEMKSLEQNNKNALANVKYHVQAQASLDR